MTITPRALSTNLQDALYTFLSDPLLEGKIKFVYKDGDGIPTLGVGYALIVDVGTGGVSNWKLRGQTDAIPLGTYEAELLAAGITLSSTQLTDLRAKLINAAKLLNGQPGGSNPFNFGSGADILGWTLTEAQMKQLVYNIIPDYETRVQNWLGNNAVYTSLQGSQEMFALVSLAFNGILGNKLRQNILSGDRAEAWYEIRYGTNGGASPNRGVAKRRYYESEMFGLYDNPGGAVSADEAKQAYRTLQLHRNNILRYEAKYGLLPDGTRGTSYPSTDPRTGLELARDLGAAVINLLPQQQVKSLSDEFISARDALFADLLIKYPVGMAGLNASDFAPTNIYLDPVQSSVVLLEGHSAFLNSAVDPLTGLENFYTRDILIGEDGNDYLMGGTGDDVLIGGTGMDTYYWRTGDGNDRIIDEDRQGLIVINNGTAQDLYAGGVFIKQGTSNIWKKITPDGELTLTHNSPWKIITPDGSEIELGDFQDGDFGIRLVDTPTLSAPPAPDLTIVGDLKSLDTDPATAGVQEGYDVLDNLIVGEEAAPNRVDTLYDSAGNDRIIGLGGNDIIYAFRGGADLLEGGTGLDYVSGGEGADTLIGGTDSDVLLGGAHNDQLFATEIVADLAAAIVAGETQPGTGSRGDWLSGDDGIDTLVGDAGNDMMLGGEGEDLLIGGGGNDYLSGDESGSASIGWAAIRSVVVSGSAEIYNTTVTNGSTEDAAVGAADVVYGGAGDDWLEGDQGNDIIDAGADNDIVFGGQGADVILGQSGNDILIGNAGVNDPLNDGADYIDGGLGNDKLLGAGGNDYLLGGAGNDELRGDGNGTSAADEGEDVLDGGSGDDTLWGGGRNDILLGGADNDYLNGEAGDDTLDGGAGADYLAGGADDDTYLNVTGEDTVYDTQGNNTIVLAMANGLSPDSLAATVRTGSDGGLYTELAVTLDDGSTLRLDSPFFVSGSNTLQFANGDVLDLEPLVGTTLTTPLYLALDDSGGRVYGGAGDDGTAKLRQSKPRRQQQLRQRTLHRTRNANRIAQRHILLPALHRADIGAMQA